MDIRNQFTKWTRGREMGGRTPYESRHTRPATPEDPANFDYIAHTAKARADYEYGLELDNLMAEQAPAPEPEPETGEQVLDSMEKGGMIHKTGLYRLHKGEMVIPKKDVKKYIR